jgi:hypothetical protein
MVVMVFAALILFGIGDTLIKMVGGTGGPRGNKVVVETKIGNLTQLQMHNLIQKRRIVHRFVVLAFIRSHPEYEKISQYMLPGVIQQFGFGGISEPEIVQTWLYRNEARKLGIAFSDKQVNDHFDRLTNGKLSKKKFETILSELQIGSRELVDIFRDELEAVTAFRMEFPNIEPSPEKYWNYYEQLNTKQKIEVASVPVQEYIGTVAEPTDTQIAKLFDQHKEDSELAVDGEFKPGFRQPRRVKLQYLEIRFADIEAQARSAGTVTEKEVEDYYEANKGIDRRLHEMDTGLDDDAGPIDPEFAPENGEKLPRDEPASDSDSANRPAGEPGAADGETAQPPVGRPTTDDPKSKDSQPDELPGDAQSDDKPNCSSGVDENDSQEDSEPSADRPKIEVPQDEEKKPGDDLQKEGAHDDEPTGPIIDAGKSSQHKAPTITYKPLDDELRDTIRESIMRERAQKLMKDLVAKVRDAMSKVAANFAVSNEVKLTEPNPKELAELERRAEAELRKIAEQFGVKFGQTELASAKELSEIPGLGKAQEPGSLDQFRGDSTSIIEQAFSGDALCRVFESQVPDSSDDYLCWKVQDVAEHVPDLKEPGVREQVVTAWKRIEALPLAQKRAEELSQRIRKSDRGFEEVLAGETVTGDAKSGAIVIGESKEFSFWREPAVPMAFNRRREQAPVQLDDPGAVEKPGLKFMHVVFDDLDAGDVGVAINDDASIYYVVKVISRRPADREAFKDVELFGDNSPYPYLARLDGKAVFEESAERFRKKYAIKFHNLPGREQGQVMADEE